MRGGDTVPDGAPFRHTGWKGSRGSQEPGGEGDIPTPGLAPW